jgi:hypothetical protein
MPIITTAKCDLCGAERKAANHWFLGRVAGDALTVTRYSDEGARDWTAGVSVLCGEACLHKWVGQNLGGLVLPLGPAPWLWLMPMPVPVEKPVEGVENLTQAARIASEK